MSDGWEDSFVSMAINTNQPKPKKAEMTLEEQNNSQLIEENFKKSKLRAKIDSMKEELNMFSRTLDPDHLKDAMEIREELVDDNSSIDEVLINTKELYEHAFKFANVASYDNVIAQLTEIQNAQDNLNQNTNNPILVKKFIEVAQKVKKNFKKAYNDDWIDPASNESGVPSTAASVFHVQQEDEIEI